MAKRNKKKSTNRPVSPPSIEVVDRLFLEKHRTSPVDSMKMSVGNHDNHETPRSIRLRLAHEFGIYSGEVTVSEFFDILLDDCSVVGPEVQDVRSLGKISDKDMRAELERLDFSGRKLGEETEATLYPIFCRAIQAVFDYSSKTTKGTGAEDTLSNLVVRDTANRKESYSSADKSDYVDSDAPNLRYTGMPDLSIYRRCDEKEYSVSTGSSVPQDAAVQDVTCSSTSQKPSTSRQPTTSASQKSSVPHRTANPAQSSVSDPPPPDDSRDQWKGNTKWELMKLFVEVKKNNDNPFNPPGTSYRPLPDSPDPTLVRGQISEYSSQIRLRQHRTSILSVSIFRSTVRFLRWDPVGVLVSAAVDLQEPAGRLAFFRFFYLVNQMSDEQLGWDSTVTLATASECKECRKHRDKLTVFGNEDDEYFREPFGKNCRLYKVQVNGDSLQTASDRWEANLPDKSSSSIPPSPPKHFIIGRLLVGNGSFTGSCTKGFVAFDLSKKTFGFLKDTWRMDYSENGQERNDHPWPEIVVYQRLHQGGVKWIPTILCGGDVHNTTGEREKQRTSSHRYLNMWRARIHVRLVMEELGKPLKRHTNSFEFISAVCYALKAHEMAWILCEILHRDISSGNVMIVKRNGKIVGILIDWELARVLAQLDEGPRNAYRSGTWPFLSAALINFPKKPYELSDDLESFVHLVSLFALRFYPTSKTKPLKSLNNFVMTKYYDGSIDDGNEEKLTTMESGRPGFKLGPAASPPFRTLLRELFALCKAHYDAKLSTWQRIYPKSEAPQQPLGAFIDVDLPAFEELWEPTEMDAAPHPPSVASGDGEFFDIPESESAVSCASPSSRAPTSPPSSPKTTTSNDGWSSRAVSEVPQSEAEMASDGEAISVLSSAEEDGDSNSAVEMALSKLPTTQLDTHHAMLDLFRIAMQTKGWRQFETPHDYLEEAKEYRSDLPPKTVTDRSAAVAKTPTLSRPSGAARVSAGGRGSRSSGKRGADAASVTVVKRTRRK